MKNTHHTPGPWKIATFDGPNEYASIESESESVRICDIPSWPCAVDEMRANAHLIAAAPDLLSALKLLLDKLHIHAPSLFENKHMEGAIIKAEKAIVKAKGEK